MKLTVLERLTLLGILPAEGDFTTIKIIRELRESLSFSEKELDLLQFQQDERGSVKWTEGVAEEKEFDFGKIAVRIIEDSLKQCNDAKKLTVDHITLYEKFIND